MNEKLKKEAIGTWYGKPISEMEKPELLEIIKKLGSFQRQQEEQPQLTPNQTEGEKP